jgi:hypothetical protein
MRIGDAIPSKATSLTVPCEGWSNGGQTVVKMRAKKSQKVARGGPVKCWSNAGQKVASRRALRPTSPARGPGSGPPGRCGRRVRATSWPCAGWDSDFTPFFSNTALKASCGGLEGFESSAKDLASVSKAACSPRPKLGVPLVLEGPPTGLLSRVFDQRETGRPSAGVGANLSISMKAKLSSQVGIIKMHIFHGDCWSVSGSHHTGVPIRGGLEGRPASGSLQRPRSASSQGWRRRRGTGRAAGGRRVG